MLTADVFCSDIGCFGSILKAAFLKQAKLYPDQLFDTRKGSITEASFEIGIL